MSKHKALKKLSVKALNEVEGNKSIVEAVLTAPVQDSDGEIYDTWSMMVPTKGTDKLTPAKDLSGDEPLNIPIFTNHDLETGGINRDIKNVIGNVISGKLNESGEFVTKLFFSSIKEAQDIYTLIKEGVLDDCLSLVYWHYGESSDGVIYNAEPFQLGVVWKSANQRARVYAAAKSFKGEESNMDLETKKKELAAKQAEVEALQTEVNDAEADTSKQDNSESEDADAEKAKQEADDQAKADAEAKVKADLEAETARKAEEDKVKAEADEAKEKDSEDMTEKQTAAKAAASKPNSDVKHESQNSGDSEEARTLAAKSLVALRNRDLGAVRELNKEIEKNIDTDTKKVAAKAAAAAADGRAPYGDFEGTFTQALIDTDVSRLYQEAGGLVSKVTKKHLTGNNTSYRKRVRNDRFVYAPAAYGKAKKVQHTSNAWFEAKVQPWAVIAAWDEELAEDAPYDFYQEVTTDLTDGALYNEEFMIMGFSGGTFAGRVYEKTGILPLLKTAGGRYAQYAANSTFINTLTTALGNVRSTSRNAQYNLTMTRATRANLAGIQDADGRLLFSGGNSVDLGLLGSVEIVEVDDAILPAGQILVGDLSQYIDVEKGGVKLLASQHASVDGVSLYQTDGEALRARQRIGGGILFNEAFFVLGTAAVGTGITVPTQPAAQA